MTAILKQRSGTGADQAEWALRCDMAAVFRACARLGWNEQIGNHNSLMLPGEQPLFLINPRGMLFRELTASSLIVCDLNGNVVRGTGTLRKVAFHIHARIHMLNPNAVCVLHVHPRYLTALSMIEGGRLSLSHHNNLRLNDRIVYDDASYEPVGDIDEGDRIARLLGDKTIMVMGSHGVTVVGGTAHDAFGECCTAESTAMFQMTARTAKRPLGLLPEKGRVGHLGPWGQISDSRMLLDAWRRVLDKEEPDYAS
ncbi:MAG: class II aldolase/adducin family protein [Alphaproteobacteria bacterium]|nr:class II aldolase/adducin family protein [Alphaproteobacteria bacterium]